MAKLSIFLVGDDPALAASLAATLGHQVPVNVVACVRDESCALQKLTQQDNNADLVIVDLFLQGGSGLDVLRRTQGLRHRREMVVLSNFSSHVMRRKCIALGADRVFDKTTEIGSLADYCESLAATTH